jgi:hypothetical protein
VLGDTIITATIPGTTLRGSFALTIV